MADAQICSQFCHFFCPPRLPTSNPLVPVSGLSNFSGAVFAIILCRDRGGSQAVRKKIAGGEKQGRKQGLVAQDRQTSPDLGRSRQEKSPGLPRSGLPAAWGRSGSCGSCGSSAGKRQAASAGQVLLSAPIRRQTAQIAAVRLFSGVNLTFLPAVACSVAPGVKVSLSPCPHPAVAAFRLCAMRWAQV